MPARSAQQQLTRTDTRCLCLYLLFPACLAFLPSLAIAAPQIALAYGDNYTQTYVPAQNYTQTVQYVAAQPTIQYVQAPPQIQYVQAPAPPPRVVYVDRPVVAAAAPTPPIVVGIPTPVPTPFPTPVAVPTPVNVAVPVSQDIS